MTTAIQIKAQLKLLMALAKGQGRSHIEVNAGEFHRMIGGYPPKRGHHHNMPMVCDAMWAEARLGNADTICLPKGKGRKGASLTIRYDFPRPEATHA